MLNRCETWFSGAILIVHYFVYIVNQQWHNCVKKITDYQKEEYFPQSRIFLLY